MMTHYPPYKAPHLAPALAQLQNRLCSRCSVWHTPFGPGQASWELFGPAPSFTSAAALEISLGGAIWKACLSDISCILRHEAFSSQGGFELDMLPQEVQKAVLSSLFAPALRLLQDSTGKEAFIRSISLVPEKLPAGGACFKVTLSGDASREDGVLFAFLAPAGMEAALEAAEILKALPLRPNPSLAEAMASIPLEVALETGYLFLSLEDVKTLEKGDMLLPEAWPFSQGRAGLRVCHGISAALTGECSLRDGAAVLETPLAEEVENCMDNNNDLEIRLSFELDRRIITVGELSSIAPGFTFPLTGAADPLVTVRANGKAVARGRIVDMDGTPGVQVTETL